MPLKGQSINKNLCDAPVSHVKHPQLVQRQINYHKIYKVLDVEQAWSWTALFDVQTALLSSHSYMNCY